MTDRTKAGFTEAEQLGFDFEPRIHIDEPAADPVPDTEADASSSEHSAESPYSEYEEHDAPRDKPATARLVLGKGATMADLLQLIAADPELAPTKERNLASSVRKFIEYLGVDLHMPADFPTYREHLRRFSLANARISKARWANIRSDVSFALKRYDARTRPPLPKDLLPAWLELRERMPTVSVKRGLSAFLHWASSHGIEPGQVDDATMTAFHRHMIQETFQRKPDAIYRMTCQQWNAAVGTVPDWPQRLVSVPSFRKLVSLPRETLPESFWDDFARYRKIRLGLDLSSDHGYESRADKSTLEGHEAKLRRFSSAMIRCGRPAQEIVDLKSLFDSPWCKQALQAEFERMGGPRPSLQELAGTLLAIGRHFVGLPQDRVEELRRIKQRLKIRPRGFTARNRERLRQFTDPGNRYAFLHFAERMLEDANKAPSAHKRALRIQTALLHAILVAAPIRLQNLTGLHVHRHFRYSGAGRKGHVYLIIPADEVKNEQELEYALPIPVAQLLRRYLDEARPLLLTGDDAGWLFPGATPGEHKNHTTLSTQLCRALNKHTGMDVNPHLYRHIAAYLYLKQRPGDLETVRRLLGHTTQETTAMFYADIDRLMASRIYNDAILEHSLQPSPSGTKTRGGRRKS